MDYWTSLEGVFVLRLLKEDDAPLIPGPAASAPDSFQKWMGVKFPLFNPNPTRFHTTLAFVWNIGRVHGQFGVVLVDQIVLQLQERPLPKEMHPSAGNHSAE